MISKSNFAMNCVVPENFHIPTPRKVIGNSKGGWGFSKAKLFKGKFEAKLEIPVGRGVKT